MAKPKKAQRKARPAARTAGHGSPAVSRGRTARTRDDASRESVRRARPARSSAAAGSARRVPARPPQQDRRTAEPEHTQSPTAVAAEALRTGVLSGVAPPGPDAEEIPGETERMQAGDPDDGTLRNEYVGEDTPGGSTPTPDQGNVDDIGRAYGVQEEDSGELRTSAEILDRRDTRRRSGGGGGERHQR